LGFCMSPGLSGSSVCTSALLRDFFLLINVDGPGPWVGRGAIGVARTIGIPTGEPLGIGAFNGKASHPFPECILDGQRIGHVMTGATEFCALHHHVVIALVDQKLALLVGYVTLEDCADIGISGRTVIGGRQRPEAFPLLENLGVAAGTERGMIDRGP